MNPVSTRDAEDVVGQLIDAVRAALVVIAKGLRPIIVLFVGEYQGLKAIDSTKEAA